MEMDTRLSCRSQAGICLILSLFWDEETWGKEEEGHKSAHVTKRVGGTTPARKRFGQALRDRMLVDRNQQLASASEELVTAVSWRILKGWTREMVGH